jgi:hypothetical protein
MKDNVWNFFLYMMALVVALLCLFGGLAGIGCTIKLLGIE